MDLLQIRRHSRSLNENHPPATGSSFLNIDRTYNKSRSCFALNNMEDGVFELRNCKINLSNSNGTPISDEVRNVMLKVPSPTITPAITNALHDAENKDGETKEGSNVTVIVNIPNAQKNKHDTSPAFHGTSHCSMKHCGKCKDDSSDIDTQENIVLSSDANVSNPTICLLYTSDAADE